MTNMFTKAKQQQQYYDPHVFSLLAYQSQIQTFIMVHCDLSWESSSLGKGNLRSKRSEKMKIAVAESNIQKLHTKEEKASIHVSGKGRDL